jgi:Ca-activated chloride channel homolog
MKFLFLIVLTFLTWVDPATVKKINAAKSAAEDAFKSGDYNTAIKHYQYLVDSMGVKEDEVVLNLANAYYLAKDTANAFNSYEMVTESPKSAIKSKANQQLGIMANKQGRSEEALNFFKQAIKAEPANDDARYNYEMLKKKLEEKKKEEEEEEKQQQNKDQEKQDQQNKDQQNKDQDQKDKQEQDQGMIRKERTSRTKISSRKSRSRRKKNRRNNRKKNSRRKSNGSSNKRSHRKRRCLSTAKSSSR